MNNIELAGLAAFAIMTMAAWLIFYTEFHDHKHYAYWFTFPRWELAIASVATFALIVHAYTILH